MLEIAKSGAEAEINLHKTLGKFLDKIEKGDQPKIFALVRRLNEAVEEQRLSSLADEILNYKPSFFERMMGALNKKKLAQALDRAWEEVRLRAAGRTKTLNSVIAQMEKELEAEQRRLEAELRNQEELKEAYREHFVEYALVVAYMSSWVAKGRQEIASAEAAGADETTLRLLREKQQALESRALALESIMTRLPADQLTIRMLENAGISTLQETTTTAAARFASIKMTLLTIHGTLVTQGVQRLAEQGAALDANLQSVRAKLMKDVVITAANAPGENRQREAEGLRRIVSDTRELVDLVDKAEAANQQKFEQARAITQQARQDLAELGAIIRPDIPLQS
jgi:hypothetical protein